MNFILSAKIFYIITLEFSLKLFQYNIWIFNFFREMFKCWSNFFHAFAAGKYRYHITRFAVIKISSFLLQNSFLSSFQASPLFHFTSPNACAPNPQSNLYPLVIEILEFSLKAFPFFFFKSVSLEHFPATIDNLLRKIFYFFFTLLKCFFLWWSHNRLSFGFGNNCRFFFCLHFQCIKRELNFYRTILREFITKFRF